MNYSGDTEGLRGAGKIPAYRSAVKLSRAVNEFALKIYETKQGKPEIDRLYRKANLIAAKIAGGHCLGYDREFFAENIRLCREANARRFFLCYWNRILKRRRFFPCVN